MSQKVTVKAFSYISVDLTINEERDGYRIASIKGWHGRSHAEFCNEVAEKLERQHPELYNEIFNNIVYDKTNREKHTQSNRQ